MNIHYENKQIVNVKTFYYFFGKDSKSYHIYFVFSSICEGIA